MPNDKKTGDKVKLRPDVYPEEVTSLKEDGIRHEVIYTIHEITPSGRLLQLRKPTKRPGGILSGFLDSDNFTLVND